MENNTENRGTGLIDPQKIMENPIQEPKKIRIKQDGLMERQESKVLTEDGRELLKEN